MVAAGQRAAAFQANSFDHAVLNLRHDLDAGEAAFRSLGFTLTDRGYHSLGSMNHLIVFADHYFELVGVDPANPNPRRELLDWPVCMNGLVFRTGNADEHAAQLLSRGLPVQPAQSFSRPVSIGDRTLEARFRTAKLDSAYFPATRLYFCEHQTPDLIWRPEHLGHPNTAYGLKRIAVSTDQPRELAARLGDAANLYLDGAASLTSGDLRFDFVFASGPPRVSDVVFAVESIEAFKSSLDPKWFPHLVSTRDRAARLTPCQTFGVTFEFSETW